METLQRDPVKIDHVLPSPGFAHTGSAREFGAKGARAATGSASLRFSPARTRLDPAKTLRSVGADRRWQALADAALFCLFS
jgi:hypothetical protein